MRSERDYAAELFAEIIDPFALETPFPAFELEGLVLLPQPSSVPVPGTALMMLSALGTLLSIRATRRNGA